MLLAIFLVSLIALGAVSAADSGSEDIVGIDDSTDTVGVESSSDLGISGAKNDSNVLGTNPGTYSGLAKEISSGGNIVLQHDYYTYDDYGSAIFINSAGVIDGNGAIIDMAGSTFHAFEVSASDVTIKNLTIKNGYIKGNGGAIYFSASSGTVIDCTFIGNEAATGLGGDGGAVYFSFDGEVRNCNFANNTAWYRGGAVCFGNMGAVRNCNFTNNNASNGGGVYVCNESSVVDSNFINNTAYFYGGAIIFPSYYAPGYVRNCNFINNTAVFDGGAISVYYGTIRNCNFIGNNGTRGSAIYFTYDNRALRTVSNCLFLNNRAAAEKLEITKSENNITITFKGWNTLLNAIYCDEEWETSINNVTYWGANGISNTGDSPISPPRVHTEAGQNITVCVVVNGEIVLNDVKVTDKNGMIVLDIIAGEDYYISARHDTDSYYTQAEAMSANMTYYVNVTSLTTTSKTVNITAKSNILHEVMPGKLIFILPNGTEISADYAGNGTWWALHTFEGCAAYKINASYDGLDDVTINNATVTVNKVASKLTASAKTFKAEDKTKKYSVTLKDGKGNAIKNAKVTLKVNGLTYHATTNAKGVATFSLNKLTKTGNAVISYPGDKNYKSISKKVKLTVKAQAFKTLSYGSKDKATIKKVQTILKNKGFYTFAYGRYLEIDGIYHKYTVHAVKLFQKANHLKVTGKVDYKTAQKLKIVK